MFTAENAGNSAAQISGLYITEDAAASNPLISPIDSEESNKLYINEPRDHAAHIHAMTVGEDKQPVQDAIESGDPIAIPIHISLNNGNQLYKFTVEAVPSGEVLKDPANSSYANDVYYPSEVSLSVSEPATLVDPQ